MAGGVVHLSTVHQPRDNRIHNKECVALVDAGLDLTLVVRASADEPDAVVPVVALSPRGGRLARILTGQREAWAVLNRLGPKVLHIHDPELVPLALVWTKKNRARLIYDAHEDLVDQISTKGYLPAVVKPAVRGLARFLVGLANRRADAVVATTDDVAADFDSTKTVVVRNYPWLRDFPRVDPSPVPGRAVYAGDLSEQRLLSFMIAVVKRARQDRPDAHLVLAGRPLSGAQELLDSLDDSDPVEHVGLLPPREVPDVLASASVGLIFLEPLPNYTRSLPTKLFEYMAAGVPFLASDFPFWRQEFDGFDAGRFVDSSDVEAAAVELVRLLDDADGCARMGRNGRRAIEQGLNFESQAPALVELTRRLLR